MKLARSLTLVVVCLFVVCLLPKNVFAGWVTVFDDSAYTNEGPIYQTISSEHKALKIHTLRYWTLGGREGMASLASELYSLQDAFDAPWSSTGFEEDKYKPLSAPAASQTNTLYITNDDDIYTNSVPQTNYINTPNGLISMGYADGPNFADGGASHYYTNYNPGIVYKLAVYRPDTIYVDASKSSDYGAGTNWATAKKTLQGGIDAVSSTGTVWVTNGVYDAGGKVAQGQNITNRICITTGVVMRSVNGASVTMIKGAPGSSGSNDVDAIRCAYLSGGAVLVGFTLTNGYTYEVHQGVADDRDGGGAFVVTNSVISNCVICGNMSGSYGGGVTLHDGLMNQCILFDNSSYDGGGAALYKGGSINNCLIMGNTGLRYGGAVELYKGGVINNCTLVGNQAVSDGGGLDIYNSGTVRNCIVWSNYVGGTVDNIYNSGGTLLYTCSSDGVTHGTDNCITNHPLFADYATDDFALQSSSPCRNTGNNVFAPTNVSPYDLAGNLRIQETIVDMGAYEFSALPSPDVIYVDASRPDDTGAGTNWITAKKTIQGAVDVVSSTGTIWVTNGVYNSGSAITPGYACSNRVVITNAITVRSVNGAAITIIEGAPGSNGSNDVDSIRGVYMIGGCSLIGFAITNGFTMATGSSIFDQSGGGILMWTNCTATNLVIQDNMANEDGGGVYLCTGGTLDNCILNGNKATSEGAGLYAYQNGTLNNCTLNDNISYGNGGGAFLNSDGTLNSCTLNANASTANWGGGVYLYQGGTLNNCSVMTNSSTYGGGAYLFHGGTLNNCTLRENTVSGGAGGACLDTSGTINNCLVISNSAANYAGGVECDYAGDETLNNCTIVGNSASSGCGGVYLYQAGILNNCIVYGNTGSIGQDIYPDAGGTIRYTCASDGLTNGVNGCSTNDPGFVGECRLTQYSPCFNTGDNLYAPTNVSPYDLADNTRIMFDVVDMGAYEAQVMLSTNQCLPAGGDTIIVTNGMLGAEDITNVTVCGSVAVIVDQGSNWVEITLGASTNEYQTITGDIMIQSTSVGDTLFTGVFTYLRGTNLSFYADASMADDTGDGCTWATAKKTIQAAAGLTLDGDTIWVTNGTYDSNCAVSQGFCFNEPGDD